MGNYMGWMCSTLLGRKFKILIKTFKSNYHMEDLVVE